MIKLILFLQREGGIARTPVLPLSVAAGVMRGLLIVLFNAALVSSVATGRLIAASGAVLAIYVACFYLVRTSTQDFVERLQSALRLKLLVLLNRVNASFLFDFEGGNLQNILTNDIRRIANYSVQLFGDLQALVLVIFCFGYIYWVSVLAGIVGTLGFCLAAMVCLCCDLRAQPRIDGAQSATSRFLDLVADVVRGFKELHLNHRKRDDLEHDLSSTLDEIRSCSVSAERFINVSAVVAQIGLFGIVGAIVFILPVAGLLTKAAAIEILAVILFAYGPLDTLLARYASLARAKVSLTRLERLEGRLLDAEKRLPSTATVRPEATEFKSITLEQLSLTLPAINDYTSEHQHRAPASFTLGPLDFTIECGQTVFLHGDNGSGKTTLLTLICGLRQPDTGRVLVDGALRPASDLAPLFSAVFADFHLFQRFYGLSPQARMQLGGYLAQLGLSGRVKIDAARLDIQALSSGQRRRFALAIALAESRPVLLLDEFVADQDPFYRAYFYERLLPQLRAEGRTIIAVTHDESRLHLCDRLFKMADGKLQRDAIGAIATQPALGALNRRAAIT